MSLLLVGVDEVGRGPVAGPVVVCAFFRDTEHITDEHLLSFYPKSKLKDSKKLTPKSRAQIATELNKLKDHGVGWALAKRDAHEIDELGISTCLSLCVEEALTNLCHTLSLSSQALVIKLDGSLKAPSNFSNQEVIIKGDEKVLEISCASIIAKESRDSEMRAFAKMYPRYGFELNVGYGTSTHLDALTTHGLTPIHRKTFLTRLKE